MGNIITSIRISKDIIDRLKCIATERDRSVNYIINELINNGLKNYK